MSFLAMCPVIILQPWFGAVLRQSNVMSLGGFLFCFVFAFVLVLQAKLKLAVHVLAYYLSQCLPKSWCHFSYIQNYPDILCPPLLWCVVPSIILLLIVIVKMFTEISRHKQVTNFELFFWIWDEILYCLLHPILPHPTHDFPWVQCVHTAHGT